MGFILKLDRTLPNFTFQIISFDELTNTIVFEFSGGEPSYNIIFTDQASNPLNGVDGFTYTTTGSKTETLTAEFGVTTIIGIITDGNGLELTDSIMVNFTTTTTEFQPIVTQINPSNLKFGGFISNTNQEFGQDSPSFNETSLDQLANIDDLIIDTTINKLELLDYDDNFKYEVDVDFSINIEYDGILNIGETVSVLIPRIRLELPINTLRETVSTFQPQFALTSWRLYNIDSIAYELNEIILTNSNDSFTFNVSGKVELNVEINTASIISNIIEEINNDITTNAIIRLNRNQNTNNPLSVISSTIHHNNNIVNNTINFNIGQTTITFTYTPPSGVFVDNYYIGSIIRVSDINQPQYLLDSGDNGLAEALLFTIINATFFSNTLELEIIGGVPDYIISIYGHGLVLDTENTDPASGTLIDEFTYNTNGIKIETSIPTDLNTSTIGIVATDGDGNEVNLFIPISQSTSTTTTTSPGGGGISPNAPSNASAQLFSNDGGDADDIVLTWIDNSTNESGFRISRSTNGGPYAVLTTTSANVTSYNNLNLPSGTYRYRITAFNTNGESGFTTSNLVTIS